MMSRSRWRWKLSIPPGVYDTRIWPREGSPMPVQEERLLTTFLQELAQNKAFERSCMRQPEQDPDLLEAMIERWDAKRYRYMAELARYHDSIGNVTGARHWRFKGLRCWTDCKSCVGCADVTF